jgi:DB module
MPERNIVAGSVYSLSPEYEKHFLECCRKSDSITEAVSEEYCSYDKLSTAMRRRYRPGDSGIDLFDDRPLEFQREFFFCMSQGFDATNCCIMKKKVSEECFEWCKGTNYEHFDWAPCHGEKKYYQSIVYAMKCYSDLLVDVKWDSFAGVDTISIPIDSVEYE